MTDSQNLPVYQPVVTLGNILTMVAMAVGVFLAYSDLRAVDVALSSRMTGLQENFNEAAVETRRVRPEIEARLRMVEASRSGDLENLSSLRRDLAEMKLEVRELLGELRKANAGKP